MNRLSTANKGKDAWLNDQLVDAYGLMIARRSIEGFGPNSAHRPVHVFSSHFMDKLIGKDPITKEWKGDFDYEGVQGWSKRCRWCKGDLFKLGKLFIPIHADECQHWVLACIDFEKKEFIYRNSFDSKKTKQRAGEYFISYVKRYLKREVQKIWENEEDAAKMAADIDTWKTSYWVEGQPLQTNGHDCGIFVLMTESYLALNLTPTYKQADCEFFRCLVTFELMGSMDVNGTHLPRYNQSNPV